MTTETQQKSEWTTKRLLDWTSDYLASGDIDQPRLCAEILLAHVLRCQRIELYVKFDYCPTPVQLTDYRGLVKRCAAHEPVAYLTGKAHFYSLEFEVGPDVLIPRPETEVIVTAAIEFLRHQTHRSTVDVLDLCTGSGCIAVAIGANVVEAEVVAVDKSAAALQIAAKNVERHDLGSRITLVESDLFGGVDSAGKGLFDLIVSNPPYIAEGEHAALPADVRDHEPAEALLAGADGLGYHRRILTDAEPYLADEGALMVEVAYNQAGAVKRLFEQAGYLKNVSSMKDELGHERVVAARRQ